MVGYDPTQRDAFYRSLLAHPGERGEVDYKSSVPLDRRSSFSLKLVRHILGMANSGGGWIVIGYLENPTLVPDPEHTDEICASYDPTRLAGRVNSVVRESNESVIVSVNQVPNPYTGLHYPIIAIEGFTRGPFFCKSTLQAEDTEETILTEGSLYVRKSSASTVSLTEPTDWEALIDRCVQMRRDEFLRQFQDLASQMGLSTFSSAGLQTTPPSVSDSRDWLSEIRARAMARNLRLDGTPE